MDRRLLTPLREVTRAAREVEARSAVPIGAGLALLLVIVWAVCSLLDAPPRIVLGLVIFVCCGVIPLTRWEWGVLGIPGALMVQDVVEGVSMGGLTVVGPYDVCVLSTALGWLVSGSAHGREGPSQSRRRFDLTTWGALGLVVSWQIGNMVRLRYGAPLTMNVKPFETLLVFFLTRSLCSDPAWAHRAVCAAAVYGAANGLLGCMQHFGISDFRNPWIVRGYVQPRAYLYWLTGIGGAETQVATGTFRHFLGLALYLGLSAPLAAALALAAKDRARKGWWAAAAAVAVLGMLLTYSRGALAAGVVAGAALYFAYARVRGRSALIPVLLLVLGMVLVAHKTMSRAGYEQTLSYDTRVELMKAQMASFPANGLELALGRGTQAVTSGVGGGPVGNESQYMGQLIDHGLVGLTSLLVALAGLMLGFREARRGAALTEAQYVLIATAGAGLFIAVKGITDPGISGFVGLGVFAILAGIASGCSRHPKPEKPFAPSSVPGRGGGVPLRVSARPVRDARPAAPRTPEGPPPAPRLPAGRSGPMGPPRLP